MDEHVDNTTTSIKQNQLQANESAQELSQIEILKAQVLTLHQALLVTNNDRGRLYLELQKLAKSNNNQSKNENKDIDDMPDLIHFDNDDDDNNKKQSETSASQEVTVKDLSEKLKALSTKLSVTESDKKILKSEIKKSKLDLSAERSKSEKLLKENSILKQKIERLNNQIRDAANHMQIQNMRDSGVSDSEDETETSFSSASVATAGQRPRSAVPLVTSTSNKRNKTKPRREKENQKKAGKTSTKISRPDTSDQKTKDQEKYNNPKDPGNLESVLQSFAQEKLKTASLTEQVENLQNMINAKNLASRRLLETENIELEDCREKIKVYESRMEAMTEQYSFVEATCSDLEIANAQLQTEIETIGEYINIYRQQRTALKQMQYQENQNQIKLEEERNELKAKLEYLVLLVRQLLADRTMLSQDQPDLNEEELNTTEQIYEVIDEVANENGLEVEPVQFKVEYFGPQQDV